MFCSVLNASGLLYTGAVGAGPFIMVVIGPGPTCGLFSRDLA